MSYMESDFSQYSFIDPVSLICKKHDQINGVITHITRPDIKELSPRFYSTSKFSFGLTTSDPINNNTRSLSNKNKSNINITDKAKILADIIFSYQIAYSRAGSLLKYAYITDGEGDWIRYIQKRLSESIGFGMNIYSSKWDMSKLITIGDFLNISNDINNYDDFIELVEKTIGNSNTDIVLCDALLSDQNFLLTTYIAMTLLYSRESIITGGNLVVRLNETYSIFIDSIIYLISLCFEWITVFKPVVTTQRYLICVNYKRDSKVYATIKDKVFRKDLSIITYDDNRFNYYMKEVYLKTCNIIDESTYNIDLLNTILNY